MRPWWLVPIVCLLACAPGPVTRVSGIPEGPPFDAVLAERGVFAFSVERGRIVSEASCSVAFEVMTPDGVTSDALVIVAHGFLRNATRMRGWAEHLASHGVRTAVVSFCRSTPFAGRHDGNAVDLRAVAEHLGAARRVYVGFSAGGLAATLAAAGDGRAVALVGLDAVDSGSLAAQAVGSLPPALFLVAEPSSCNAQGNMIPVLRASAAEIVRIPAATHCDFENPTDPACARLCGRVEPAEAAAAIGARIRALATAFVLRYLRG